MMRWNPHRCNGPHSKRIHTGGSLELALMKQSPDSLETRQKQAENQTLGYSGWGKCLWSYENLGRNF